MALDVKNCQLIIMYSAPTLIYKLTSCGVVKSFVTEVRRVREHLTDGMDNRLENDENQSNPAKVVDNQRNPLL